MGCEIGWDHIESGLVLAHPYGITVNGGAKIGRDCTLFKGCTIGSIRGGNKAGVPVLGNRVVVCCNAMCLLLPERMLISMFRITV